MLNLLHVIANLCKKLKGMLNLIIYKLLIAFALNILSDRRYFMQDWDF